MEMIKALDKNLDPRDAIEVLEKKVEEIEEGKVQGEKLVIQKKTSKYLQQYQAYNRIVAALERYKRHGIEMKPGQSVRYLVYNDSLKIWTG